MFLLSILGVLTIAYLIAVPPAEAYIPRTRGQIEDYIIYKAQKEALDVNLVLAIANCESGINPRAVGDSGRSYGIWQIHLPAHPTITREQAMDPLWSTRWAMDHMSAGRWKMWTCHGIALNQLAMI